mmetsp:Transcript_13031/g.20891  ORF Transcript_13031/g.20891 Transcript_13031/m.20891 type:complete len:270 (+) Transcript_13031:110-919(+)
MQGGGQQPKSPNSQHLIIDFLNVPKASPCVHSEVSISNTEDIRIQQPIMKNWCTGVPSKRKTMKSHYDAFLPTPFPPPTLRLPNFSRKSVTSRHEDGTQTHRVSDLTSRVSDLKLRPSSRRNRSLSIPPSLTPSMLQSLRVAIPKRSNLSKARDGVPNTPSISSVLISPPLRGSVSSRASSKHRKRPLHQWKSRHVSRWVAKFDREAAKMAIFKGIDGTHLLAIENEEGFIKLGWSRDSKKLKYLLKDLQVLQTEDMVWKINNLNLKLK